MTRSIIIRQNRNDWIVSWFPDTPEGWAEFHSLQEEGVYPVNGWDSCYAAETVDGEPDLEAMRAAEEAEE